MVYMKSATAYFGKGAYRTIYYQTLCNISNNLKTFFYIKAFAGKLLLFFCYTLKFLEQILKNFFIRQVLIAGALLLFLIFCFACNHQVQAFEQNVYHTDVCKSLKKIILTYPHMYKCTYIGQIRRSWGVSHRLGSRRRL